MFNILTTNAFSWAMSNTTASPSGTPVMEGAATAATDGWPSEHLRLLGE
jgi:hypothetical protein